ncbi:MAG TPA: hypothetical protein VM791_04230 [Vicinamibacterales bacterium]|jgi:hypothetical protein|nr:hypothetical protein [Vicinamibacterales bacterium]
MLSAFVLTLLLLEQQPPISTARLQVFLDCNDCFADYLREEIDFVDFVRDRTQATVHVIITNTGTASGGLEYVLAFVGQGAFSGQDTTLKAVTQTGDPEDVRRRQLLTTLRIGLLSYLARAGVPQGLQLDVELPSSAQAPGARRDPWDYWVFSLRGSASFNGEESAKEREVSAEISADRITPDWKLTFGFDIEDEVQEFDLDEDEPVETNRRERDFDSLIVKALGEHWSLGARGTIESSTFDNISLRLEAAPAIEFNFFPYAAYQRRQLRSQYAVGVRGQQYYEETLYGKTSEVLPAHELSVSYDQREQWGSVEGNIEWFQYLHDLSKSRLEANGEISWRILRGLSISADASASRIRDQISLRSRGATDEEIFLRLRELQSGYEYDFSLSITYTFGSIFSSIVNPRFGQ